MNLQETQSRVFIRILALLIIVSFLVRIWGVTYGGLASCNHDDRIPLSTARHNNVEINIQKIWGAPGHV